MSFGINEVNSYKITIFFAYFLAISGFFYLFRQTNRFLALIGSLIYGLTPYVFLNIFVRGALGETISMSFMPWALVGILERRKILTVLSLSFILISHNFLGILFLFFLILFLLWNKRLNIFTVTTILLSLGLSAFFLLPMIFERQYIVSGANNNFTFNYQEHFLYLRQLLYGKWDYWYSIPGPNDGMSFQLGFANIIILILSISTIIYRKKINNLFYLTVIYIGSCILTQGFSFPLWKLIRPLQIVQFPWRFLFITTIISPLLFFENASYWINKKRTITLAVSIVIIIFALINVRNYRRPMDFQSPEKYNVYLDLYTNKTTTAIREEISPKWTLKEKFAGDISSRFTIFPANTNLFTIRKNYFPTWKLIDLSKNIVIPIEPDADGNITAKLSEGTYLLKNGQTPLEIISNYISLFSLLVLFAPSLLRVANR
jgi:hypothetical protein